jgi:AcrR family transcriptional regulator
MGRITSSQEHLNGRERLLEAAINLFGRDGFDGTSVRAVADEAGVSWGLVRFYFGSKDGLRDAVEEHVMKVYLQRVRDANRVRSYEELDSLIESQTQGLLEVANFMRRAIMEERPVALEFVRELLTTTEALNSEARTAFPDEPALWDPIRLVAQRVGYLLLAPQIQALLGRDLFSVGELKRRNLLDSRINELTLLGLATKRPAESGD